MTRTLLAAALLLLATGCRSDASDAAPPSPSETSAPSGLIVFDDGDGPLYTVKPDGSELTEIGSGHDLAHFSHDGTVIAMSAEAPGGRVTTAFVNRDGTGLTVQPIPDETMSLVCWSWTPDDARLACEAWDDAHPERAPGIFSIDVAGWDDLRRLTSSPLGGHDIPGAFSPDGRLLAFAREHAAKGRMAIFVANADGSDARRLTSWRQNVSEPRFSPDGRLVLFSGGKGHPETIRPDGTQHRRISLDVEGYAFQPVWSPDGEHIVFTLDGTDDGIYIADADGQNVRPVATDDFASFNNPDWGP